MTIGELVHQLSQFNAAAEVACTWEGTIQEIEVYRAADGKILIDGDNGDYKVQHQKTRCGRCGKQAWTDKLNINGVMTHIVPVCVSCWSQS